MASFFAFGIDVINNPAIGTVSGKGQDGAGQMRLEGGHQPFGDDALVEFITQNETSRGELDGHSSFIGIKVYENVAAYNDGVVQYTYVPMNPGQSANIQSDLSGLGDTYVRFNANVLVPRNAEGQPVHEAPTFGNLLVAPGSDAAKNFGKLTFDRHTDQDFDGDGKIEKGSLEDGNGLFYVGTSAPCFTPGTLIATPRGAVRIEDLRAGDMVLTRDDGPQPIAWAGSKTLSGADLRLRPHMQPVLVKAGALGGGLPERDMLVSPNHRLLISSPGAALHFGEEEVLVAAKHMAGDAGIVTRACRAVTYIHILFETHQVVKSDGAWTESFQPGVQSLRGMGQGQREEILELFPQLGAEEGVASYGAARRTLRRFEAQLLRA
ncbi:Hint domain-containing protein [Salipiger sp. IMCC34102]|uniref:Hint domain-containing protein n=1 Tax=Salipiger sp. IMCC34102 TaxID=2510647 RepID=UPI00101C0E98|nr:Hint domain-containing protein [Salipiger sp. IMCC34102]RYH02408.1 Hint domain-containing protein [Salipiger sp. IMCC34102]